MKPGEEHSLRIVAEDGFDDEDFMCANTGKVGNENGTRVSDLNNFSMRDDELSIIPSDISRAIAERARDVLIF